MRVHWAPFRGIMPGHSAAVAPGGGDPHELSEAGGFLERQAGARAAGERPWIRVSLKQAQQRSDKEIEGHQRRGWVTGKAKEELVAQPGEKNGFARTNRNSMEKNL